MRFGWMLLAMAAMAVLAQVSPARAASQLCLVADPQDTSLNVRDAPNGKLVNRLRNGRAVFIEAMRNDTRGRPWAHVTGYYKGDFRDWGWVFFRHLDCFGVKGEQTPANAGYPLIFTRAADLKPLGVALRNYGPDSDAVTPYENRCHYYGDGGNSISVSDDVLRLFEARGFTLNSLCMALVSGILFDPETGRRLPSYIVVDEQALRQNGFAEAGDISEELPLDVPGCFARGVPLTDCTFNYHPLSGRKLSDRSRGWFRQAGETVLEALTSELLAGNFAMPCTCAQRGQGSQSCRTEKAGDCPDDVYIAGRLAVEPFHSPVIPQEAFIGFYDISPSLELGFGYALFADGSAGPSGEVGSEELVLAGKNRATKAAIQAVLNARAGN